MQKKNRKYMLQKGFNFKAWVQGKPNILRLLHLFSKQESFAISLVFPFHTTWNVHNSINVGAKVFWVHYNYNLLSYRIFVDDHMLFNSSTWDFDFHCQTYATFFYWLFYFNHNYWILDLEFMLQKNIIDLLLGYNPIL